MLKRTIDLPDFLQGYTGPLGDEGISFSDRAFWIDDALRIDACWLDALRAVDEHGDKKPLTTLLRSSRKLSPVVREYLSDLIERKMVPVPNSRPRIAAYDRSIIEAQLLLGVASARDYVKGGASVEEAIAKAAKEYPEISVDTLGAAYAGQRTPNRRIADRHRPSKRSKRRGALK